MTQAHLFCSGVWLLAEWRMILEISKEELTLSNRNCVNCKIVLSILKSKRKNKKNGEISIKWFVFETRKRKVNEENRKNGEININRFPFTLYVLEIDYFYFFQRRHLLKFLKQKYIFEIRWYFEWQDNIWIDKSGK